MTVQHWNGRAKLGQRAGTDDLIAKTLEQRALLATLPQRDLRILEIGCGRGETAQLVAERHSELVAVDSAPEMISEALEEAPDIDFRVGDLFEIEGEYDVIYTQRCLINVANQERAFQTIADHLVPGGLYISIECSQDGLDAINESRVALGLPSISPPYSWHRYLLDAELRKIDCLEQVMCWNFSNLYYFLSRVVNAKDAAERGEEPSYDAPVNFLALELPPEDGPYAQTRLWLWQKPWQPWEKL